MKNLSTYFNKDSFDIGIRHRGAYFAVNQREENGQILIHSPLFGRKSTIMMPLFEGVSFCYCRIKTNDPICVLQNPNDPDMITLTFIVQGAIEYGMTPGSGRLIQSGYAFLDTFPEERAYNDIPAGTDLLSIDLHLDRYIYTKYLFEMIESGALASKNENILHFPDSYQITLTSFSPEIHHLFLQILNCPYQGRQRTFYLKMKTREIMFHYFNELQKTLDLSPQKQISVFGTTLRDKLYDLKDLINSHHYHITGLSEISKIIGLSETTMQREFKKLFGFTIMQYQKKMILKKGYDLLQQGESVKNTAFLIGYSSSAAFSKAFFKEYGIRPSELSG